jgi:hypothetical protein
VNGEHRGLIARSKIDFLERLPTNLRGAADDSFVERVTAPIHGQAVFVRLGDQPAHVAQIANRVHPPRERQPVAPAQHGRRRNRRDHLFFAFELGQVNALQSAQARAFNGLPIERTGMCDGRLADEFTRLILELLARGPARRQDDRRHHHDDDQT